MSPALDLTSKITLFDDEEETDLNWRRPCSVGGRLQVIVPKTLDIEKQYVRKKGPRHPLISILYDTCHAPHVRSRVFQSTNYLGLIIPGYSTYYTPNSSLTHKKLSRLGTGSSLRRLPEVVRIEPFRELRINVHHMYIPFLCVCNRGPIVVARFVLLQSDAE